MSISFLVFVIIPKNLDTHFAISMVGGQRMNLIQVNVHRNIHVNVLINIHINVYLNVHVDIHLNVHINDYDYMNVHINVPGRVSFKKVYPCAANLVNIKFKAIPLDRRHNL